MCFLDLNVVKVYCLMREIVGRSNWLISEKSIISPTFSRISPMTVQNSPSINVCRSINYSGLFFSRNAFSEAVLEPVLLRKAWINIIAIYLFMPVFFTFTARLKANLCWITIITLCFFTLYKTSHLPPPPQCIELPECIHLDTLCLNQGLRISCWCCNYR